MLSTGEATLIIPPTPIDAIQAENIHTASTTVLYFNFPPDSFSKNWPVAEVRPIEVVKQASATHTASITLPVCPKRPSVILTITCDCWASTPYIVETVAPKKQRPPYTNARPTQAKTPDFIIAFNLSLTVLYPFSLRDTIRTDASAIAAKASIVW